MSEWWSYSLSDFLLFSPRTYRHLFELYNAETWPLHLLALATGGGVCWLLWRGGALRWRVAALALAACWGWVGIGFFALRYASINWAASYLAVAFGVQALLLVLRAAQPAAAAAVRWDGLALIAFGLLLQPLIGPLLGRPWSQLEVFGMAPDPTVTVTLGLLLTAAPGRWNAWPWVIPLLWCAASGATLWAMRDPDAWAMPLVGAAALSLAAWRSRRHFRHAGRR
ncbi:MAG TPA: DUF6064 family protein [Albitalea sp.]|nr:DUF6064 family protein [Albitalea sp.]HJW10777.1 DUF6064 family protein [Albitalea sp.]